MMCKTAALLAFVAVATATDVNVSGHDSRPRTDSGLAGTPASSRCPGALFPIAGNAPILVEDWSRRFGGRQARWFDRGSREP